MSIRCTYQIKLVMTSCIVLWWCACAKQRNRKRMIWERGTCWYLLGEEDVCVIPTRTLANKRSARDATATSLTRRLHTQVRTKFPRVILWLIPIPHTRTLYPPLPAAHHLTMASLFKKAQKKPSTDQVITTMNDTLTSLDKRVDYLEHKIKHEENEAKRYMSMKPQNKRGTWMIIRGKVIINTNLPYN